MYSTRDEWKLKVDMGYRFCPNCQRDYIRGNKPTPSWVQPVSNPYRGCDNCGMGYNENPAITIENFFKQKSWRNCANHIHDVLAVQISDGGEERMAEFEKLVETVWIKRRQLYESGHYILNLAKIAITGETR